MPKEGPDKITEWELYKQFSALPKAKRKHHFKDAEGKPIETDLDFAAAHNVDPATLYRWRQNPKFQQEKLDLIRANLSDRTADVLEALADGAAGGSQNGIKLFADILGLNAKDLDSDQEQSHSSNPFDSREFSSFFALKLAKQILKMDELEGVELTAEKLSNKIVRLIEASAVSNPVVESE